MSASLTDGLALTDLARRDWYRNIVSLVESQDLYDDLATKHGDSDIARAAEMEAKPPHFRSRQPIIDRPFESAAYLQAIQFPFDHWSNSRYSTGQWGVWYGAETRYTGVCETVHHWLETLSDAIDLEWPETVEVDRRIYKVHCDAALLDLRPRLQDDPTLLDPRRYDATHILSAQLVRERQPGLVTRSARGPDAVVAVFDPAVLSGPRHHSYLQYRLATETGRITVSQPGAGTVWTLEETAVGRIREINTA